jgi:asparagine synthase (glutamine-hydrolysing)
MCGITGIATFSGASPPTAAQLSRMCNTLIHRGPDDEGMHLEESVALGMRRLAIIDLQGGQQPIFNETRTVCTVFNGEIYNFRELRHTLESRGHRFTTQTDTEVIVHAYEEYGMDFPKYLNGMFAIALHDTVHKKLVLVRDHLGIKPLYYALTHDAIVWGSEIKAILASERVERSLDLDALAAFLAWEYVPAPATLLRSVRKLPAGALLEVDLQDEKVSQSTFWQIPNTTENLRLTAEEWATRVEHQFQKSVQRQLVSDVPLGAFLSGGVDSSLIAAAMGPGKTFSIGFEDESYNELHWAQKVAAHLGLNHIDAILQPDAVNLFEQLMYYMDDPIGDFSIFSTYLVSQLARQRVTVVLSGDGGDELFGGYESYLANDMAKRYQRLPAFLRHCLLEPTLKRLKPQSQKKGAINKAKRFLEGLNHEQSLGHARWRVFAGTALQAELFTPEVLGEIQTPLENHIETLFIEAGQRQPLNQSLYVDVKSYLSDNILLKVDRMSMANSLEARVPYLDPHLVTLAFQIPEQFKVNQGQTKILLKTIAARYVPADCVYRPKEGFSIPIKNWLKREFRDLMLEHLNPHHIQQQGIFRASTITRLIREHLKGKANHSHILWSLIVFQNWQKRWLS